jgi:hypothetical protein
VDAVGVEAVHRLVEDEHGRVPEERRGDAKPLAHAQREAFARRPAPFGPRKPVTMPGRTEKERPSTAMVEP